MLTVCTIAATSDLRVTEYRHPEAWKLVIGRPYCLRVVVAVWENAASKEKRCTRCKQIKCLSNSLR